MNRRGAVLPVVVTVLLCISFMLLGLLKLPGSVLKVSQRFMQKQQAIYDAESEVLRFVNGLPAPEVSVTAVGPWLELSLPAVDFGQLQVMAGRQNDSIGRPQKRAIGEAFGTNLARGILLGKNMRLKSGNRRLLGNAADYVSPDGDKSLSLVVNDGDLLLDLFGQAGSCNLKSSGAITVKGSATFDTLRLYASGPIVIAGSVKVGWLEAYGGEGLEVSGSARFSGFGVARDQVVLQEKALARFPSSLISLNASVLYDEKNLEAPLLLPAGYMEGRGGLVPFSWRLQ